MLLDAGADRESKDKNGSTPMDLLLMGKMCDSNTVRTCGLVSAPDPWCISETQRLLDQPKPAGAPSWWGKLTLKKLLASHRR